jgi:hypothetical protein
LKHCTASQKATGSRPDEVIGFSFSICLILPDYIKLPTRMVAKLNSANWRIGLKGYSPINIDGKRLATYQKEDEIQEDLRSAGGTAFHENRL